MANTFDSDPRPSPLRGFACPSHLAMRRRESAASMEGALSMPPDRGAIIGRALWKARHVVVGTARREQPQPAAASRIQSNRSSTPRELARAPTEGVFLSIYKSKEDPEPIQQHSINSITDCQVQMLAHRKQGPVLPTLVINLVPDPMLDKVRKRRSSRTAAFAAPKDSGPTTLLFRPGDEQYTLQEWARFIQQLIQPHMPDRAPMSPVTPASPTFINPFSPRSREPSDAQNRPESGNSSSRQGFALRGSGQTLSGRDRPVTFSDSPSLRSKRSDLSSQTSSMNQPHMSYHSYTTGVPADLPSPATTIGEYQADFIEGWTSAQGRSSALSSPIRGRDSVSSQAPAPLPTILDSSSSPRPRETILDRAFQMRRIPGSEREIPGEEKLTSLARFDALMRDMDEKRKQREAEEAKLKKEAEALPRTRPENLAPQSAWDDDSDSDSDQVSDDHDDDSDELVGEGEPDVEYRHTSPATSAQRAIDFISGRYEPSQRQPTPGGHGARCPPSYNHEAFMALSSSGSSQLRPQTGYSKNRGRPGMAPRTHSQPHLATIMASSPALREGSPSFPVGDSEDGAFSLGGVSRSSTEKRQSASSAQRLSFTEFARRLSNTSSLLLVQTNASGGSSSRASNSEMDFAAPPQSPPPPLHHLHPRATPRTSLHQQQPAPQLPPPLGERDRCGWRGSVGVFGGGDGGFL